MKKLNIAKILFTSGSVLIVIGAIAKIFNFTFIPNISTSAAYIFSIGAAFLIYNQLVYVLENKNSDKRQKRLSRNGLFTSLLLGLAAYFMFTGSNSWVVMVLIYALSTLFLSFRGVKK